MVARISRRHVCHLCRRTRPMRLSLVALCVFCLLQNMRSTFERATWLRFYYSRFARFLFFVFGCCFLLLWHSFFVACLVRFLFLSLLILYSWLSLSFPSLSCFLAFPTFLPSYLPTFLLISEIINNNIYIKLISFVCAYMCACARTWGMRLKARHKKRVAILATQCCYPKNPIRYKSLARSACATRWPRQASRRGAFLPHLHPLL